MDEAGRAVAFPEMNGRALVCELVWKSEPGIPGPDNRSTDSGW